MPNNSQEETEDVPQSERVADEVKQAVFERRMKTIRDRLGDVVKPPDFMRMIPPTQKLKTVMNEEGVDLDPPTPTERTIRGGISRVWSTLWGWTGSVLKMFKTDNQGNMMVRPFCWPPGSESPWIKSKAGNLEWDQDFTDVYDYVSVYCIGAPFYVLVKNPDGSIDNTFFVKTSFYDGTNYHYFGEMFVRTSFIVITGFGGSGDVTYYVNAKSLSRES